MFSFTALIMAICNFVTVIFSLCRQPMIPPTTLVVVDDVMTTEEKEGQTEFCDCRKVQ